MNRNVRKRTFVYYMYPREDSDQPAHPRSLIGIFTERILDSKDVKFLHANNEDSDQTAQMRRMI